MPSKYLLKKAIEALPAIVGIVFGVILSFFQRCWICSWTCMGFDFSIAGLTRGMNDVKIEKVHFLKEHKHFWICWFKLTSKDEMSSQRKLMEILKQIERPRPSTIDQMLYVWYRCIGINSCLVSKQLCRLPE